MKARRVVKCTRLAAWLLGLASAWCGWAQGGVLKHSDVVFMYQAEKNAYQEYGATVLAWGSLPTSQSLEQNQGLKVFASVGMVTEFSRYYERFPETYEQGLCRDVNGQPVKVPWLTDHQHRGIPYWWCCTQQPQFRRYLSERVVATVKAGADGVHIDDHLGTAGGLWLGICFCDRCVAGFRSYLGSLPAAERQRLGIDHLETFNYQDVVKQWLAADTSKRRTPSQHPLWSQWTVYQCRAAAAFMQELKELAARTAGRPVPMAANAGLLWPRHLADYKAVDLFSAETEHHADQEKFSDVPLFAYHLADAVGRPYAATASGGDWAYIKAHNLPGLVRSWIALSYAAGHCLMAPNRQWCYTPEKGTHWYQGPAEKFAPLYQFVRQHAALFDEYDSLADIAVVMPHRSFLADPKRWFELGQQLAARNISYRLVLGGDEVVDHAITAAELSAASILLIPERDALLPSDRRLVDDYARTKPALHTVSEVMDRVMPAVQVESQAPVRTFPRARPGAAVVQVVNCNYDAKQDDVRPLDAVKLRIRLAALGVPDCTEGVWTDLQGERRVKIADGLVELPNLGVWGILSLKKSPSQK